MLLLHHNRHSHGRREAVIRLLSRFKTALATTFFWPQMTWRQRTLRYIIAVVMLFTLFGGNRGLYRLAIVLHDRTALQQEIQGLVARRAALKTELHNYTSDPATLEKFVREQLDMVKPGETVYKFPSSR